MRICAVIASLGAGGAERVLLTLADAWAARGDEVTLVTLSGRDSDHYPVPPGVSRIALDRLDRGGRFELARALRANLDRLTALRHAIVGAEPDAVVSFGDRMNVRVLLALRDVDIPVIVSERSDPRQHRIGRIWEVLRGISYRNARALVMQTEGLRAWGSRRLSPFRVHVIPNPMRPRTGPRTPVASRPREVIAVGRLSHEKGFDLLLEAFAQVHLQCPDWRLRIVGDGPDMEALRKLARQRIPSHAVVFNGRIADPQPLLDNAQLFVLSSRYEGFPNVLLEAMAAGCACIATDCQSGPADMITTGVSGLLVPPNRVETLAAGMLQLIGAPAVREQYGLAASRGVERFAIDGVVRQWDAVLATATTERAA